MMAWINAQERLPNYETEVPCRLKHAFSGRVQEHALIRVEEDDCTWRTADDRCEIDYSWNVVEWFEA